MTYAVRDQRIRRDKRLWNTGPDVTYASEGPMKRTPDYSVPGIATGPAATGGTERLNVTNAARVNNAANVNNAPRNQRACGQEDLPTPILCNTTPNSGRLGNGGGRRSVTSPKPKRAVPTPLTFRSLALPLLQQLPVGLNVST